MDVEVYINGELKRKDSIDSDSSIVYQPPFELNPGDTLKYVEGAGKGEKEKIFEKTVEEKELFSGRYNR